MDITIVSVSEDSICLSINNADDYKLLLKIFQVNDKQEIFYVQIADKDFKSRLDILDSLDKRYRRLKANLNGIPNGTKYLVLPNYYEDSIELINLKNQVFKINNLEIDSSIMLIPDKIRQFSSKYWVRVYEGDGKAQSFGVVDKFDRVCRFCNRSMPDVSFAHKSHAITEALGNKSLICREECDECNERFSRTIEPHITNMHSFLLSFYCVKGKNGVKKVKGRNFKLSIDKSNETAGDIDTICIQYDGLINDSDDIKSIINNITLDTSSLTFIPQNVYKCFCKYVISVLDNKYLPNFQKTINWINEEPTRPIKLPPIYSYNNPDHLSGPTMLICIRKSDDYNSPYCIAVLTIVNKSYIYILPFSSQDKYRFVNPKKQDLFKRIVKQWLDHPGISLISLASPNRTYTSINLYGKVEQGCQLRKDYFIKKENQ